MQLFSVEKAAECRSDQFEMLVATAIDARIDLTAKIVAEGLRSNT